MRVILQQEVANLGKVGDQVTVRSGYGRNYLLPKGMAALATLRISEGSKPDELN